MRDQRGFSIRDDPLAEMFGLKDVRRGREHTSSNTKSLTGVVQRELGGVCSLFSAGRPLL